MTAQERLPDIGEARTIHVRTGTPEDVHEMMQIALMACEENGFVSPEPLKLLQEIWAALNLHDGICGIIGEPGKSIEAAVLLRIGSMWYSAETKVIEERAIFVHPQFRAARGGRAKKLCEFSKQLSDTLQLPLTIGVMSSERTEAKVRMYRRILGEPSGAYWLYNARTGNSAHPTMSSD